MFWGEMCDVLYIFISPETKIQVDTETYSVLFLLHKTEEELPADRTEQLPESSLNT